MAIVENNVVKMEWEKSGWLQTKASGHLSSAFIFASKEYASPVKGTVTVFFNADVAFLWVSDAHSDSEDMWNASELKEWCKTEMDGSFPEMHAEYVELISSGEDTCIDAILEEYGLTEHKADIEARLQDVRPFGEEYEIKLG